MSKFDKEVEKVYFNLTEVSEILNKEFNFQGKDLIVPGTIHYWKKEGYIIYGIAKGTQVKVTVEELNNIRGFAYLHIYLGISKRKTKEISRYLKKLSIGIYNSIEHFQKYISLYDYELKTKE